MSNTYGTAKPSASDRRAVEHLTGEDTKPTPSGSRVSLTTILIAAAIIAFAIWMTGAFDKALVGAHLNKNDCGTNALGNTMCGAELEAQQQRIDAVERLLR